jgi:hypothetical protein
LLPQRLRVLGRVDLTGTTRHERIHPDRGRPQWKTIWRTTDWLLEVDSPLHI